MSDCPNCGAQVEEGVRLCPQCGFDTGESQAEEVRALREAGRIHPGRLGAEDPDDFEGGEPVTRPPPDVELPDEAAGRDPREFEEGL